MGVYWWYLSVAGEGGVVKQEVGTEEHHDGIVNTQDGPVDEDGPPQQRVLGDVSIEKKLRLITSESSERLHI